MTHQTLLYRTARYIPAMFTHLLLKHNTEKYDARRVASGSFPSIRSNKQITNGTYLFEYR